MSPERKGESSATAGTQSASNCTASASEEVTIAVLLASVPIV